MNRNCITRATLLLGSVAVISACATRPPPGTVEAPAEAPAATPPPASQRSFFIVVVERGQSLDQIAQTYRVTKQQIIATNNLAPPYALKPGMVLQIPGSAAQGKDAPKPKPTPASTTAAKPADRPGEPAVSAPRRPKRQPPEVIPLD